MLQLGLELGPGNVFFSSFFFFFFSLLEVTHIFVLRVSGNCNVRGVRTTTVCDVTVMYSQERYMENVPLRSIMPCSRTNYYVILLGACMPVTLISHYV